MNSETGVMLAQLNSIPASAAYVGGGGGGGVIITTIFLHRLSLIIKHFPF
jgi:hypothetical protein